MARVKASDFAHSLGTPDGCVGSLIRNCGGATGTFYRGTPMTCFMSRPRKSGRSSFAVQRVSGYVHPMRVPFVLLADVVLH